MRTLFFFCFFFSFQQRSGGSPLTLRPNFKSEKGSVTAAAAACMPRRGIFVGGNLLYNLRVMHCRTVQVKCELFSFFALKGSLIYKLANAIKIKLPTCTSNISKNQHYRYRQGQQSALASPRRTARYERIPPDGFDTAALEIMQRTLPRHFHLLRHTEMHRSRYTAPLLLTIFALCPSIKTIFCSKSHL